VPNKGRMFKQTLELLKNSGFEPKDFNERRLYVETKLGDVNILFLRTEDIGPYIQSNVADLGITGYDIVVEKRLSVEKLLDLNYGFCKLVLAGPKRKEIKDGIRIATKYQNITKQYLKEKNIQAEIINSSGATEIKPKLGIADFIVDVTSTGSTLKMNNLVVYEVLLESNAVLIANKKSSIEKKKEIADIKLAIESVTPAENRSYVTFNISKDILSKIIDEIPCMKASTILKTWDDSIVSVQTVVPTNHISKMISKLKNFGTTNILVMDIKRVVGE
jgi:ATP phosphoribosyltransferase